MESARWKILRGLTLSLFIAGCVTSMPERIDGSPFEQAQYDLDEAGCRAQARKKFPTLNQKEKFTKTPKVLPPTDHRQFSIMEFNTCMQLKGWKNF